MPEHFAHSSQHDSWVLRKSTEHFQPLLDHLRGVAEGAEDRARLTRVAGLAELARAAGWLHDLGKYRPEFQQLLLGGRRRGDAEAYHKQAGAAHAAERGNLPLALVIAGHHGGLPDSVDFKSLTKREVCPAGLPVRDQVRPLAEADGVDFTLPRIPKWDAFDGELFTRVLFGCLIDADWSDTARHERSWKYLGEPDEPAPPALDPAKRLEHVLAHVADKAAKVAEPEVGAARQDVLAACLGAAEGSRNVFSLTVPTGGGKTLAALAFALKHAAKHELRRVIYVAPYMTILEQNADAIRKALGVGDNAADVFTHYSLAEPAGDDGDPDSASRRAENWDAPVVVTTNVQFFESLFANNPGRCRKLPNVARSVIILDECQSLPPGLVAPTCLMLNQLVAKLGCTVVLCTATQPAFDHDSLQHDERLTAVEIAPPSLALFKRLERVAVEWPEPGAKLDWPEVADLMQAEPRRQALCVTNTKKAALAVYQELKNRGLSGVFYLSTAMCPQHRREKLAEIRKRIAAGAPCYVASTQLIEAGVDLDVPLVLREMAPLEGVIQAAGRCNREGRLRDAGGAKMLGRVVVIRSLDEKAIPGGWYKSGRDVLESHFLSRGALPAIDDPAVIRDYYGRLYYLKGADALDAPKIRDDRKRFNFERVADNYRLITDAGQPAIVTTWGPHQAEVKLLLDELERWPRSRRLYRALAKFQVNLLPSKLGRLPGLLSRTDSGALKWDGKYDDDVGIVEEADGEFVI